MGDSAFPCSDRCISAYKRVRGTNSLPAEMHRFNQHLASTRVVIEHAFGMLKMRFQSLRTFRSQIDTPTDLYRSLNWTRAAMILHNFLIAQGDVDDFWDDYDMPTLEARFEAEAAEMQDLWETFTADLEPRVPGRRAVDDAKRRFVKKFAEDRQYDHAYADDG